MPDAEKRDSIKSHFTLWRVFSFLAWGMVMAIFFHGPAYSNEGAVMKDAQFWPREADDWKVAEGPTDYGPTTAHKYMNGAAELFNAYNMKKLIVLRYGKAKRPDIVLEIYEMASPADSSGLFSFETDDPGADIGQGSEFGGGLLRFWKGRYFVSVYGDGQGADMEAATLNLGRTVAGAIKETGRQADILEFLPPGDAPYAKGRTWYLHSHILLNQRFFIAHSNILKLAADVEVALGQYGSGKDKVHVLLVKYPTPGGAESAFLSFTKAYMSDAGGKPAVRTENNKWTASVKNGVYVAAIFDAADEASALKMTKATTGRLPKEAK